MEKEVSHRSIKTAIVNYCDINCNYIVDSNICILRLLLFMATKAVRTHDDLKIMI